MNTVDLRERIALSADFSPAERNFILQAVNVLEPPDAEKHEVRNYLGRIEAIWAALSIDEHGEGLCAAPIGNMTLPLIAADKRRLEIIRPRAQHISTLFKKPVRIAKFTNREDVEIFQP